MISAEPSPCKAGTPDALLKANVATALSEGHGLLDSGISCGVNARRRRLRCDRPDPCDLGWMRMDAVDLQLNGYKGVDFNVDDLSLDSLRRACESLRADGGGRMLATVITDRLDLMVGRISRLAAFRSQDDLVRDVMAGIHVEGPFISPLPGYVGAHPAAHVIPATQDAAGRLLDAGGGLVRLVTLAPEHDAEFATTRFLSRQGVIVSAGHCDPTFDILAGAVAAGLSCFTHLGNGCPLLLHRHDNIIQRVLATEGLRWVMVIPDGVHVPTVALRNIVRGVGIERLIAVTDATAAGGMGPGRYTLGGREVVVGEDGAAWAADRSHLVGSTATVAQIREVLRTAAGLSAGAVEQVTAINPARAIAAAPR
jgi:N-acetylglucosamine-6-phosphate deacetylase